MIKKYFVKDGKLRSKSYIRFNRSPTYESLYTQEYRKKYLVECGDDSTQPKQALITQLRQDYE
jgi:hypothetical protein